MSNIRIDLEATVTNGQPLTFKAPVDCSQITGLIVYYPDGDVVTSKTFQFADAHGNNVGSISLFSENVLVKVILDTELSRAYVQNADTNAYLEDRINRARPYNLLDNSDFTNPVNQGGIGITTTRYAYPIDRWQFDNGAATGASVGFDSADRCFKLDATGVTTGFSAVYHTIEASRIMPGEYTLAFHAVGSSAGTCQVIILVDGTTIKTDNKLNPNTHDGLCVVNFTVSDKPSDTLFVGIYAFAGKYLHLDWAALYEGEYTLDTLPKYQPKGYAVESLACGVITKDYVVAQGTSGDWHYRKWNSGRAECWYCEWFVPTASGLNPATLAHSYKQTFTLPFSFTDIMYSVNATIQHGSGYGIITRTVVGSASTFSVFWDANSAMSTADARISVQVNGYWK